MFTGLVTDVGRITRGRNSDAGRELRIESSYRDLVAGESIAVNGICLTVREFGAADSGSWFTCAAVVTTAERTTVSDWTEGQLVNLERALQASDRLGGHFVLGHVDAVATVRSVESYDDALLIDLELPPSLMPLMVAHGSVAVDGVSLTVNALLPDGIQLSIIEYTRRHTALDPLVTGSRVNIEADIVAKHVERLMAPRLASLQEST